MSFFEELKRRNVFRVGIAYVLMGWVLLQGADFVLDVIGAPDWAIRTLIVFVMFGLPMALFFAWAFEVTPDGIKREADVDRTQSITPQTGRKLDRAIIVFLALAVVLLLGDRYFLEEGPVEPGATDVSSTQETTESSDEAPEKSIAVLPFVNMSSDPEQEYFSDGISEEILNSLAKVGALKVAGRTSSFAFKGRNEDLRGIGEMLRVEHILEGSVRKSGNRVRITAQLIQAEDGFHLWSETYDRELTDIFAVQDDIANQILAAMKTALSVEPDLMRDSLDQESYEKYLRARQLVRKRDAEPTLQALALFEEINERKPEFAPAWTHRAQALWTLRSYGRDAWNDGMLGQGRTYLERAEALDPDDPEMLAAWGLYYRFTGEMEQSIDYLERALAINPSLIDASNWLWYWRFGQRRYQEAYAINKRIREIDPLYLPTSGNIDYDFMFLGLTEEFADHVSQIKAQLTDIDERYPHQGELLLALAQSEYAQAVKLWNPELNRWPFQQEFVAEALLKLGEPERAARIAAGGPWEMIAFSRAGRLEESDFARQDTIAQFPEVANYYVLALASESRWAEAVTIIDQHPGLTEHLGPLSNFLFGWGGASIAGRWAEAMRETGDEARFESFLSLFGQLLDELENEGVNNANYHFSRAYHATLKNDKDGALASLARVADAGSFTPPNFIAQWPSFEMLRGDPRFETIVSRMAERRNEQRAELGLSPIEEAPNG